MDTQAPSALFGPHVERMGSPKAPHLSWRASLSTIARPELALQELVVETRRIKMPTSSCILALEKMRGWVSSAPRCRASMEQKVRYILKSYLPDAICRTETRMVSNSRGLSPTYLKMSGRGAAESMEFLFDLDAGKIRRQRRGTSICHPDCHSTVD